MQMENDLKATDTETRDYLNRFRSNNKVFVYTMMRFFVGYKWDEIGDIFGESAINVRSTVMRAFAREKAAEGKAAAAEGDSFRDSS